MKQKIDVESGLSTTLLYPNMLESPELRWVFIRKVYSIVAVQLLLTIAFAAAIISAEPISVFFTTTSAGWALFSVLIITPFIGKIVLEAATVATGFVVSLTLYTFWAARKGHEFNFIWALLYGAILMSIIFTFLQFISPGSEIGYVLRFRASIMFCGYVLYDTDNLLIKRYSYDDYVWASVSLYLDIINLFLASLSIFRAAD